MVAGTTSYHNVTPLIMVGQSPTISDGGRQADGIEETGLCFAASKHGFFLLGLELPPAYQIIPLLRRVMGYFFSTLLESHNSILFLR
jgi:hypothetical protein